MASAVPRPKVFQKRPQRAGAVPQQFQFLPRFGQVHGHRHLFRRPTVRPRPPTAPDGRCTGRGDSSPGRQLAGLTVRLREMRFGPASSRRQRRSAVGAINSWKTRDSQRGGRGISSDRPAGLGDVAQRGDAAAKALVQARATTGCGDRCPAACRRKVHHPAKPIDEADARLAQRRRQVAEIEMRVGVDQSRQDRHVAQVADVLAACRRPLAGPTATMRSPSIVTKPSGIGGPATGKT